MKGYLRTLLILMCLFLNTRQAFAVFIVDTGEGSGFTSRGLNNQNQHAVPFTLNNQSTITSLEFWIQSPRADRLGTAKLSLFDDHIGTPGNNLIFSGSELIEQGNHWDGLTNLNLSLSSGQYWLAIDNISDPVPVGGGFFSDVDITLQQGQANPLPSTAFRSDKLSDPWTVSSDSFYSVGARINAEDSNVVPEPATLILFASGLGVLIRRRQKSKMKT